mmetsp:Transcript_15621/g.44295  ORF Transcript_15621/g.44295 Transcript_15621/m.44295 type:complete len:1063 (+) Transcript_15621:197-3385(+)
MPLSLYVAQISIFGAQGLRPADYLGMGDPYLAIKYGGILIARTGAKKKTLNPEWNQTFVIGPLSYGREVQLEVWDQDSYGLDSCLGCINLMVDKATVCTKRQCPLLIRRSGEKEEDDLARGHVLLSFDIRPVQSDVVGKAGAGTPAAIILEKSHSLLRRGLSKMMYQDRNIDLHAEVENNNLSAIIKGVTPANVNLRNNRQETLVHKACGVGNLDIVKHLVENKADINLQDRSGWTPLHCAASCGFFQICAYLVEHNADVDALNKDGTSAVHYLVRQPIEEAVQDDFKNLLQKLVANGTNLNCQNKNGESPLHQACQRRNVVGVRLLLENKTIINILNKFGETPLAIAARHNFPEIVDILLEHGADASSVDFDGLTEDIKAKLVSHGGQSQNQAAGVGKISAVRIIPIRATSLLPPAKGKERQAIFDVTFGDKKQREEGKQVSVKHNSFKWASTTFDFPITPANRESKMKVKLLDDKNGEPLGYIGFTVKDLPELKGERGMHLAWHTLRKCAGQKEVSGKLRFCVCYVDSKGTPIGTEFAKSSEAGGPMASISVFGVLRGQCSSPGCDCESYQPGASAGGPCFNCGHYPAKHKKMGDNDTGTSSKKTSSKRTKRHHQSGKKPSTIKADGKKSTPKGGKKKSEEKDVDPDKVSEQMLTASWAVDPKEITLMEPPLGEGTFAKVYKGKYRGQTVAVKVLKSKVGPKQLDEFQKEFAIMSAIRTPHVVFFYGACVNPTLYMVMEFCSRGTLYDVLKNEDHEIDWKLALKLCTDTVRGIWCLHSWKPQIVHRDLKSLNLLVDENFTVKVCDFGQSRFTEGAAKNASTLGKLRGTYHYCAPEVYFGKQYTTKADVFSIAVILWEIIYRTLTREYLQPYADQPHLTFDFQIIIQTAKKGLRPSFPENTPEHWKAVVERCWDADPTKRPECPELLEALAELQKEYEESKLAWDGAVAAKKEKVVEPEKPAKESSEEESSEESSSEDSSDSDSDSDSSDDSSSDDSSSDDDDSSSSDDSSTDDDSSSEDDSGSSSSSEAEDDKAEEDKAVADKAEEDKAVDDKMEDNSAI